MEKSDLKGYRVAVVATDGFEESELTQPMHALRESGAEVRVLSLKIGEIQGFQHHDKGGTVPVDGKLVDARPHDFDALLLPGGALNADALRTVPAVQKFVTAIRQAGKPMAVICHAPWILVSAGLARGLRLTSYHTIQDDIRNAGGDWVDQEVVVEPGLVTSRKPDDIPAFNREMLRMFQDHLERRSDRSAA